MPKFIKKPVVIEAIQYDGTENSVVEILQLKETTSCAKAIRVDAGCLLINTLEGVIRANKGDWVVKEVNGELYPYKPDIFEQTYEPANLRNNVILAGLSKIAHSAETAQSGIGDVAASISQLVKDLAEWSKKYPRGKVYPMSKMSMDDELIELEERAKELSQHLP